MGTFKATQVGFYKDGRNILEIIIKKKEKMVQRVSKDILQYIVKIGNLDPKEISFFRATCKHIYSSLEDAAIRYRKRSELTKITLSIKDKHFRMFTWFICRHQTEMWRYIIEYTVKSNSRRFVMAAIYAAITRGGMAYLRHQASVAYQNGFDDLFIWINTMRLNTNEKPHKVLEYIEKELE